MGILDARARTEDMAKWHILQDNEAVIKIYPTGHTTAFRHLHRTHPLAVDLLYAVVHCNMTRLVAVNTEYQIADVFAKSITKIQRAQSTARLGTTKKLSKIPGAIERSKSDSDVLEESLNETNVTP